MEDDEDLEFLRLAALKSLKAKKENVPTSLSSSEIPALNQPSKAATAPSIPFAGDNHIIPVVNNLSGVRPIDEYFPTVPVIIRHPNDTFIGSQFEKINLHDQYVPQRINVANNYGPIAPEYVPYGSAPITVPSVSNVQLSPRSAAFVLQNNDILMRRKGGVSPKSPRSRSPSPYRSNLGRWSATPPPMGGKKLSSRSPKRSPYRRSTSRSPHRRASRSPIGARRSPNPVRNRSLSRSPQRTARRSPAMNRSKRSKSRTSPSRYNRPPRSKTPPHHHTRHGNSPTNHGQQGRPWNGNHARKSKSPRNEATTNSTHRSPPRRRTRSPPANRLDPRKHSASPSPARKYYRSGPPNRRRKSPPRKYNNRSRNPRGAYGVRKSTSPSSRRRSGSTGSPLQKNRTDEKPVVDNVDKESKKKQEPIENNVKSEEIRKDVKKKESTPASNQAKEKTAGRTEQQLEDELLASTDDEKNSDSEDDNNDDGIDLFASEESESENEGRFKSNSSKTERTGSGTTVSFSKLGTNEIAPADALRDLDDLRPNKSTSYGKGGVRDKDRDRESRNSRNSSSKYSSRRDDRFSRKSRPSSRDRDRGSSRGNSWKSTKDDTRKKEMDSEAKSENERKPVMFKSTFQIVDNEPKKTVLERGRTAFRNLMQSLSSKTFDFRFCIAEKTPGKPGDTKEKTGSGDRKTALQLKRSIISIEDKGNFITTIICGFSLHYFDNTVNYDKNELHRSKRRRQGGWTSVINCIRCIVPTFTVTE